MAINLRRHVRFYAAFMLQNEQSFTECFSPGLGTVGVGWVCGPIDTGGGASAAPVGVPDPPVAASPRCIQGQRVQV